MKELEQHLEPRVSRVEAKVDGALEAIANLTTNIRDLSSAVKEQGEQSTVWREKLMISIERASAPRKTDWQVLMTLATLIIAVGALAFTPLLWRQGETQKDVDQLAALFSEHQRLTLHPVGASKVDAMEKSLVERSQHNREDITQLDEKLQHEFSLMEARTHEKIAALQKEFENVRQEGSPITRERLAVLENNLRDLKQHFDATHPIKAAP